MNLPIYHFALREDLKEDKRFLPTRAEPSSSGWDVRAAMDDRQPLVIRPFGYVRIPLGFRTFCPEGWWLELKPRSSTFAKKQLHSLYGTIDEGFEGTMVFACQYIPDFEFGSGYVTSSRIVDYFTSNALRINFGDAIGQILPVRRQEFNRAEVSNEQYDAMCKERNGTRKDGGFGSTGA